MNGEQGSAPLAAKSEGSESIETWILIDRCGVELARRGASSDGDGERAGSVTTHSSSRVTVVMVEGGRFTSIICDPHPSFADPGQRAGAGKLPSALVPRREERTHVIDDSRRLKERYECLAQLLI